MIFDIIEHMTNDVALISPVYQNYDILQDFFDSLSKQKNKNFKVFIADLSKNKQNIDSKNVKMALIKTDNLGYSYGVNVGIRKALEEGFTKFCVLNNDTYVGVDFIDNLLKSFANNSSSVFGGKIYYAPGFEYHKARYSKGDLGKVFWYAGGIVDWANAYTKHRGVDQVDKHQFDKIENTEFISGCLICFDKVVWDKVGPWDEDYFLYYEDADYCERAKRKGLKLIYDPSIVLWHKVSQSTGGSGSELHKKYQEKNRIRFGLLYAPIRTKLHLLLNYIMHRS